MFFLLVKCAVILQGEIPCWGGGGAGCVYTHTLYIFINMSKHPSGCFKSKGFHHLSKENLWLLWISKDKPLSLNNE